MNAVILLELTRKSVISKIISLALLLPVYVCHADYNVLLDKCATPRAWKYLNGGEFPGAVGGLILKSGKMALKYDFSGGGKYVGCSFDKLLPSKTTSFQLEIIPSQDCAVNFRVKDACGRFFQGRPILLKKNRMTTASFNLRNGPWSNSWGGKETYKQPRLPISSFQLIIVNTGKLSSQGVLKFLRATAVCLEKPEKRFNSENIDMNGCGWRIAGEWYALEGTPVLDLNIKNIKGEKSVLEITFPKIGRNDVKRFYLDGDTLNRRISYSPPFLIKGGNINNKYEITVKIFNDKNNSSQKNILAGRMAGKINFGVPVSSSDIVNSPFGTCVHFSYGLSGAFKGWRDYRKLVDMISNCGFKWIRDGCKVQKRKNGSGTVRQWDVNWMKYALDKGVKTILLVDMSAGESLPDFLKRVKVIVNDTKEIVGVYELGNEPNNMGGWIKKYGGTWNGREKDNSTSKWVKEHLTYTNAAAKLIKELNPNATVIGLGAPSPTNFRALDLGVSTALDGVVDHPYTFSLPPEKIPYGWNMEKRDGVRVGDANNTFAGLIQSYVKKFQETQCERSLWMTEFGFTTFHFNGKNEKAFYAGFSEEAQACYLVRRFILSLTLPIKASCQYDFLDDYGSTIYNPEANFGIVRADYTPKPSYYALRRMNSLFNGFVFDSDIQIESEAPLHRSCERNELVKNWDNQGIYAANGIYAYCFLNPSIKNERTLAVWSLLPFSGEFSNRSVSLKIKGLENFNSNSVAIDIISGKSYDIPLTRDEKGRLIIKNLPVKRHPIIIKLIQSSAPQAL